MDLEQICVSACPTCGALAQHIAGEPPTWRAVHDAEWHRVLPTWHDDAYPPTEPGVYYMESCDQWGNPRPGLMFMEEGEPYQKSEIPTKYFGPIHGAFKPWQMAPVEPDAVKEAK